MKLVLAIWVKLWKRWLGLSCNCVNDVLSILVLLVLVRRLLELRMRLLILRWWLQKLCWLLSLLNVSWLLILVNTHHPKLILEPTHIHIWFNNKRVQV